MPEPAEGHDYEFLSERLRIDRDDLDSELIDQPPYFFATAKERVFAISRRDQLKDELKRAQATAYGLIRSRAEADGRKMTEAMVSAEVEEDPDVVALKEQYRKACEQADLWEALKEAWLQRSYALKDLVALHISSLAQNPSAHGGGASRARLAEADYDQARDALAKARHKRAAEATKSKQGRKELK